MGTTWIGGEERTYKRGYTRKEYTPWMFDADSTDDQPILGDAVTDYMNMNTTRTAMHIPDEV